MINVLFVCLGNICRSPMAEAIFRHEVAKYQLSDQIQVDSAGTAGWHIGQKPHEGTQTILQTHQISYEGINGRQFVDADLKKFQYIIVMDENNLSEVKAIADRLRHQAEIYRLLDFAVSSEVLDVPDPYFTGDFEETYSLVNSACKALLLYVIEENEILRRK